MQVLAKLHWISESGMGAFKAKLRKLQGEGVPDGANPGKGKRVDYTLQMACEAAIAIELLQCGMSPLEAARIVEANRREFYLAMLLGTAGNKIHGDENDPIALINPEAMRQYTVRSEDDDDPLIGKVAFMRRRTVGQLFAERIRIVPESGEAWRWAIIDLGTVAYTLLAVIELELHMDKEELIDDLMAECAANGSEIEIFRNYRLDMAFATDESGGDLDG